MRVSTRLFLLLAALLYSGLSIAYSQEPTRQQRYQQEKLMLAQSTGLAQRNGKKLSLQLASGKPAIYMNQVSCDDGPSHCVYYYYRGMLADRQFYWVVAGYYEGGDSFLISRKTGHRYDVIDEPHVSPDGENVVAASEDEAYSPSGVFLWKIKNGELSKRFYSAPTQFALYRFVRWNGSKVVELVKTTNAPNDFYTEDCPSNLFPVEFPVRLVSTKGTWKLDETVDNKQIKCISKGV
jgi:hypothetical protein